MKMLFVSQPVNRLQEGEPTTYSETQLISLVSKMLIEDGYPGPVRVKKKYSRKESNYQGGESSVFDFRFESGGEEVMTKVRSDGTVTCIMRVNIPDSERQWSQRKSNDFDNTMVGTVFRRLKLPGVWVLYKIDSTTRGAMGQYFQLVNGLRVINLNPMFNYDIYFDFKNQMASVVGNPDLPPVSSPDAEISPEEAQQKLQSFYEGTKTGIFDPKWPYKVYVKPELAYYKFSNEPQARLIYLPRLYQVLGDGTEQYIGDYNEFVDAKNGELVKADDPGWNCSLPIPQTAS